MAQNIVILWLSALLVQSSSQIGQTVYCYDLVLGKIIYGASKIDFLEFTKTSYQWQFL